MATAAPACPHAGLSRSFELGNEALEALYPCVLEGPGIHRLDDIGYWLITRHAHIKAILGDPSRFSPEIAMMPYQASSPETVEVLAAGKVAPTRIMVDNPDPVGHRRARRIVQAIFSPQRLQALVPEIERLTDAAIDSFIADGRADLVARMLYELPALVLFKLMGVDHGDVKVIKQWADNRLRFVWGRLEPDAQLAAARELVDYWRFCTGLVEAREREPRDDLPSALLAARDGEAPGLSQVEVIDIVFGILLAGHETTTNQSANTILALLETPGAWAGLVRDPACIPQAVEEGLRYRPSVIAWRRLALTDAQFDGVTIPAGAMLLLMLASGNRDPAQFASPQVFDPCRANAREHISFGFGPHFCLGAPLARLEMKIILERLTRRLPGLRLVPGQPLEPIETIQFRGPKTLWVEWDRAD